MSNVDSNIDIECEPSTDRSALPEILPIETLEEPVESVLEEAKNMLEPSSPKLKRAYNWSAKCEASRALRSANMKKNNAERARKAREYAKMKEELDKLDRVVDKHVNAFAEKVDFAGIISAHLEKATNSLKHKVEEQTLETPTTACSKRSSQRFSRTVREPTVHDRFRRFT